MKRQTNQYVNNLQAKIVHDFLGSSILLREQRLPL